VNSYTSTPLPRVGVGVIVLREGLVLLGKRKGSHGAGTWALPGGHLEFGESIDDCARRETTEETGLRLKTIQPGPYTNDFMASESKHYVTLFVQASAEGGEPQVLEPEKCEGWAWFKWSELPENLFLPLKHLLKQGFIPNEA
jgi:8-oxo-dGTP diphosphatase